MCFRRCCAALTFLVAAAASGRADVYRWDNGQEKNLAGIGLWDNNLSGWNFSEQNLANAIFVRSTLTNANLAGADTRGALHVNLTGALSDNAMLPDGRIAGLNLAQGDKLVVRNYQGDPWGSQAPIPIHVQDHMTMTSGGVLQMLFDADPWNSTMSFEPGIPVALGGTLELSFVDGVDVATQSGRTIDLFDWTGVTPTGAFSVESPYTWDLSQLYTTGQITLPTNGISSDFDLDGDVDGRDFLVWQRGESPSPLSVSDFNNWQTNFGTGDAPTQLGDFDGDSDVDGRDFLAWQRNPGVGNLADWQSYYGNVPLVAASVAIPEPSTWMLLSLATAGGNFARRRRISSRVS